MIVSVTATQRGLSDAQKEWAWERLRWKTLIAYPEISEFHHGGCIGGDAELELLVHKVREERAEAYVGWIPRIVLHRGNTPEKWATCDPDEELGPKDNIERNHVMVDTANELWAFPGEEHEVLRSGTWATIRYARWTGRKVYVVFPSGRVEEWN